MKSAIRPVGILLAALLVLIAAATLILPRLIDPGRVRDRIEAQVKEKTGRELVIAGDIGWSVFPWLGVEIADVRLANAAGFGAQPFAEIAAVQARVRLLPLMRKEVEMSTVVLDGLAIHLARTKDGRRNWDDLITPASPAKARELRPASTDVAAAIAIGGVQVRNARLSWEDHAAGTQYSIEHLNLQLGAIRQDQPIAVNLDLIAKAGAPVIESAITLTGQVIPTQAFKRIVGRDLNLKISAKGKSLPAGRLDAKLVAQLSYDLDKGSLDLNGLILNMLDLTLRGRIQGVGIGGEAPRYNGVLSVDRGNPRGLLQALGQPLPETGDRKVLKNIETGFDFQATATALQLTKVKLRLDDSTLTGTLGIKNFSKPALDFNLALDNIDLDRYLPPRQPESASAANAEGAADKPAATDAQSKAKSGGQQPNAKANNKQKAAAGVFPVEMLRALNLNGRLSIGVLKAYQLRSSDVKISVSAKDGLVQVFPAHANLYQGTYTGNIRVDVRGKQPRIALDEKVAGVQAEPLLEDMFGEAKVTGTADVALKLTAVGDRPPAMRKTLNGNARLAFTDGVIKGMDVLGEIRQAYGLLRGKPQAAGVTNQTEFSAVTGTATVTNGVVNNPDLVGKSPLLQVQGAGTANLLTELLDYRINATLVDSLEAKGELTGRPIPVQITGPFAKPKVSVDLQQVLKQEAKKQLQKQLEDKLNSDTLKGLFGR